MRVWIGLGILGLVALVTILATQLDLGALKRDIAVTRDPVNVAIYYGGEKRAFLQNPAVQKLLTGRYAITLDARRAGSVELATTLDPTGIDCLWPSTQVAIELARNSGRKVLSAETIFSSPIVFFAWDEVAAALQKAGVVHARADGHLAADLAALGPVLTGGKRWREDFGLNIYGPVSIFSTDPAKSNSGNVWSALLATMFNGGTPPTAAELPRVLPAVTAYFGRMGFMENSSGEIFENFLKQGMGARPIIVGYENQMVEFILENAQAADLIRAKVRVIYPEPTVYASHPLIALTPACARLQEALLDPEVQALAWSGHGFRTGLIGVQNDPKLLTAAPLPERVDLVVPMPAAPVMQAIINAVHG